MRDQEPKEEEVSLISYQIWAKILSRIPRIKEDLMGSAKIQCEPFQHSHIMSRT